MTMCDEDLIPLSPECVPSISCSSDDQLRNPFHGDANVSCIEGLTCHLPTSAPLLMSPSTTTGVPPRRPSLSTTANMEALEFILFMVAAMLAVFTILAEYHLRNDRVQVKGDIHVEHEAQEGEQNRPHYRYGHILSPCCVSRPMLTPPWTSTRKPVQASPNICATMVGRCLAQFSLSAIIKSPMEKCVNPPCAVIDDILKSCASLTTDTRSAILPRISSRLIKYLGVLL